MVGVFEGKIALKIRLGCSEKAMNNPQMEIRQDRWW
jgi:hypothetical protein